MAVPQNRISDFFDSYAEGFNAIYGTGNTMINRLINRFFRKSMKLRYLKTIKGCTPIEGKRVIDIGCGPGHFGITLARKGAHLVRGIDFAQGMIGLAKKNAKKHGVENRCDFVLGDFLQYPMNEKYDFSILMGFMDYIENPGKVIDKVVSITQRKAFFSFPSGTGFLAWQRKTRYKKKCNLYLYNRNQLKALFKHVECKEVKIEKISRDFFVTVFC
jgi:2-polyprenyl-3-methyl-5-hydroxy-6-metoxy-1,4-benzoquinol methylase